jgi:hypothetical protein
MSVWMIAATPASSKHRQLRRLGPALDRHVSIARIKPDRDAVWPVARGPLHQGGIPHGGGSDDDAIDALFEPSHDRLHIANAAAQLNRQRYALQDPLDRHRIDRSARKGAVEIDQVKVLEPFGLKAQRLGRRIAVEHGYALHVALLEAHADSILEVDRRK